MWSSSSFNCSNSSLKFQLNILFFHLFFLFFLSILILLLLHSICYWFLRLFLIINIPNIFTCISFTIIIIYLQLPFSSFFCFHFRYVRARDDECKALKCKVFRSPFSLFLSIYYFYFLSLIFLIFRSREVKCKVFLFFLPLHFSFLILFFVFILSFSFVRPIFFSFVIAMSKAARGREAECKAFVLFSTPYYSYSYLCSFYFSIYFVCLFRVSQGCWV